jgi:hypothetical protein
MRFQRVMSTRSLASGKLCPLFVPPDRANYIRRAEFESKEATASAVFFQIVESPDHATVSLQAVERPKAAGGRRATTASIVPLPTRERKDLA